MGRVHKEFRRTVADGVTTRLAGDLPRVTAHLGEDHVDDPHPAARTLRNAGGGFQWVAFGFTPHDMWDAHVGVLTRDDITVGIHIHEQVIDTPPTAVERLAADVGAAYRYSQVAAEHQFNRPPIRFDEVKPTTIIDEVVDLCHRFEPIVDELLDHHPSP